MYAKEIDLWSVSASVFSSSSSFLRFPPATEGLRIILPSPAISPAAPLSPPVHITPDNRADLRDSLTDLGLRYLRFFFFFFENSGVTEELIRVGTEEDKAGAERTRGRGLLRRNSPALFFELNLYIRKPGLPCA